MASLSKEKGRGTWQLTWYDGERKKHALRLGDIPKKMAESFKIRFEELVVTRRMGLPLSAGLVEWLASIDRGLKKRLAHVGLVDSIQSKTVGELCEEFLATRPNVANNTSVRDRQVAKLLLERFGADRALDSIGRADAEKWRLWLEGSGNKRDRNRKSLSDNTVRRRTGVARQIFNAAVRWKWIDENPFDGLATSVRENLERQVFVTWEDCKKVIAVAPNMQWRALIAFCRLIGPRVPSELRDLRWEDIDFTAKRVVLRSPKTKHHGGAHAMRFCPLFPELIPYLNEWAEVSREGEPLDPKSRVFPIASKGTGNLRSNLRRWIVMAGMVPWSKLFVNLRSSRETELLGAYPVTDVCRWMGHSPLIAAKFYAQARSEVADRATASFTVESGVSERATKPHPQEGSTEDKAKTPEADALDSSPGSEGESAEGSKMGSEVGTITIQQEPLPTPRKVYVFGKKKPLSGGFEGLSTPADRGVEWAKRDSNPRHLLCKSSALTN
jgi:integrase